MHNVTILEDSLYFVALFIKMQHLRKSALSVVCVFFSPKLILFRYDKYLANNVAFMSVIGADIHVIFR
jgi:hypothetical protein